MSVSGDILSHEALSFLCNCINNTVNLSKDIVLDTAIQTSSTYSSFLIENKLKQLKEENETYANSLVAGLNKLSKEVINDKSLVTQENILYLYKSDDDTSNNYMQMMLINGVSVELGTTEVDISTLYSKDECDSKFGAKLDLDTLTTSFNDLKTTLGTDGLNTTSQTVTGAINELKSDKVNKTDIVDNLTSTDTDKPLSAKQGKVLKDEVDLKANDDEVIKKTDITTTIDSTSTDSEIATAKAVNDLLQTESPGNLTIPLNEDLNNLIYNRTRVWMNSQTVQIATFTNMPSGHFTECAVIFIPYENATSTYGEQIFVGNNRIFIRNKVNTTWTAWQRVCTTTVANVPVTNIAPANTTTFISFAGNPNCNYRVKNGVCYVTLWDVRIATTGTVGTGVFLPKCSTGPSGSFLTGTMDGVSHAYGYVMGNNSELKFDVKDANIVLRGSFSYPVAES